MSTVPGGVADAPPPPPPMQAPSMKSMGDSKIPDASAVMKLTSLKSLRLHQSRAVLEAATGGAWPNKYIVCDHDLPYQPMRQGQPHGDAKPTPIMIIEEESGPCCSEDCCCRCCCNPKHPALLKFWHATQPYEDDCKCCGALCWHNPDRSDADMAQGAFLSMERLGCCTKWVNCWVCCALCQDEVRLHAGNVGSALNSGPRPGNIPEDTIIARGIMPIGGGGCTPTVELFDGANDAGISDGTPFGVVEGPTFFGGCLDLCCDTHFQISKEAGGGGDLATISKLRPRECCEWCRAICSTADAFDMEFTPEGAAMSPEQKAMLIGEIVHIDYMFFEQNRRYCEVEKQGDTIWIKILISMCYCYGCLCPCRICIPIQTKN